MLIGKDDHCDRLLRENCCKSIKHTKDWNANIIVHMCSSDVCEYNVPIMAFSELFIFMPALNKCDDCLIPKISTSDIAGFSF